MRVSQVNPSGNKIDVSAWKRREYQYAVGDLWGAYLVLLIRILVTIYCTYAALFLTYSRASSLVSWISVVSYYFIACLLYSDFTSGILHIVLDDERNKNLPFLSRHVIAFIAHHAYPFNCVNKPLVQVINETAVPHLYVCICLSISGPLFGSQHTLFISGFFSLFSMLLQFAHRNSHTPQKRKSWWGRNIWDKVLLSPEHHKHHHTTYDCNFAILCGMTNPLVNQIFNRVRSRGFYLFLLSILCTVPGFVIPRWAAREVQ